MTPTSVFLDPAWDAVAAAAQPAWPGMVYMRVTGEEVRLIDGTGVPYGFGALYVGGDGINEPLDSGINAFAVWVMGPDAQAEILAPAFDTTPAGASWADTSTGTEKLVYAHTGATETTKRGMLLPAGATYASAVPVARLLKVNSATKITIGGLTPKA
jgi:hypothetical protein